MDHNKIFGVSEREKKRVEDAEMASKTEKLLKRLAKRKDVDARMEEDVPRGSYKSKRKKNALDPHDHEVQDMAFLAQWQSITTFPNSILPSISYL